MSDTQRYTHGLVGEARLIKPQAPNVQFGKQNHQWRLRQKQLLWKDATQNILFAFMDKAIAMQIVTLRTQQCKRKTDEKEPAHISFNPKAGYHRSLARKEQKTPKASRAKHAQS
jgi:hypothetical protein